MITRLFATVITIVSATTKYDEKTPIIDVRGGTTLKVTYPPNVVDSLNGGNLNVILGNFGHIQYGSTITATMMYPDKNHDGCLPFKKAFTSNSIVLVDAGSCPVTTKVRNIEKAGG